MNARHIWSELQVLLREITVHTGLDRLRATRLSLEMMQPIAEYMVTGTVSEETPRTSVKGGGMWGSLKCSTFYIFVCVTLSDAQLVWYAFIGERDFVVRTSL